MRASLPHSYLIHKMHHVSEYRLSIRFLLPYAYSAEEDPCAPTVQPGDMNLRSHQ